MKTRNGFVSNSSSSSFLLDLSYADWANDEKKLKEKIMKMTDRSNDLTRCTGRISHIKEWLKMVADGEEPYYDFEKILKILIENRKDLIIIRESDEGMGGEFEDYNIKLEEIYPCLVYKFEYH